MQAEKPDTSFMGVGASLSGKSAAASSSSNQTVGAKSGQPNKDEKPDPWANLGSGSTFTKPTASTAANRSGGPTASTRPGHTRTQPIEIDDEDDEQEYFEVASDTDSEFNGFEDGDDHDGDEPIMIDSD